MSEGTTKIEFSSILPIHRDTTTGLPYPVSVVNSTLLYTLSDAGMLQSVYFIPQSNEYISALMVAICGMPVRLLREELKFLLNAGGHRELEFSDHMNRYYPQTRKFRNILDLSGVLTSPHDDEVRRYVMFFVEKHIICRYRDYRWSKMPTSIADRDLNKNPIISAELVFPDGAKLCPNDPTILGKWKVSCSWDEGGATSAA